ncbi:Laminin-like protein epi-1 [Termitomyces sp. J132]|nr:Laminin-like protein epi-1 [Termitomyces sp. J132]
MSETDRAAKAARAKAMLKKRQREKANETATASSVASPTNQPRTLSPAPQEPKEEYKRDISDVFAKDDSDSSWITALHRGSTPPLRIASPSVISTQSSPPVVASPPLATPQTVASQNYKDLSSDRISALETENASLQAEADRLRASESKLREAESSREKQRTQLSEQVETLRSKCGLLSTEVERLRAAESKLREVESSLEEQRTQSDRQVTNLQSECTSLSAQVQRLQDVETVSEDIKVRLEEQRHRAEELEEKLNSLEVEKEQAIRNERQTISFLVSEKSSLTSEVKRLETFESKSEILEHDLNAERTRTNVLQTELEDLKACQQESAKTIAILQSKEKDLTERHRETERELQLKTSSMNELMQEVEHHQRRVRELEEQIQSDDRVERLENSLKNTQDRADELEIQLSKLKQAHSTLKVERDGIDEQRQQHLNSALELETKVSQLQDEHKETLERLASVSSEKVTLAHEKANLESQDQTTQKTMAELQEKLIAAAATIASNSRQLQTTQNQLNSMQVELRNNAETGSLLAETLKTATNEKEQLAKQLEELAAQHERDKALVMSDSSELQQAYAELQENLNETNTSLRNLEAERSIHHQETAHRIEELETLVLTSNAQAEEILTLRKKLDVAHSAQNESQDFLGIARKEIEALRADLNAREEEVLHLRQTVTSPIRENGQQSFDEELIDSIRQQHALELSAAHSQIRALENSVFDANAHAHSLQKQINTLENQLARSRPLSRLGPRSYSPARSGLRPGSRNSDLRRSSFGSNRPMSSAGHPSSLARSIFDQNMSAETRHKRLVSLSMLKARIDIRALSPVQSVGGSRAGSPHSHIHSRTGSRVGYVGHRPQFMDDSHVFWCHSCTGDLVVL